MSFSSDDTRLPGFYGRMTRTDSETTLREYGGKDGQYLIRICPLSGKYIISLAAQSNVFHYLVKISPDGLMSLSEGKHFPRFKDLIEFYSKCPDTIQTSLSYPCPRKISTSPMRAKQATPPTSHSPPIPPPIAKLRSLSSISLVSSASSPPNTPSRSSCAIGCENYLWYHGRISRQEAEEILSEMEESLDSLKANIHTFAFHS